MLCNNSSSDEEFCLNFNICAMQIEPLGLRFSVSFKRVLYLPTTSLHFYFLSAKGKWLQW